jgi:hypothetical protein
MNISRILIRILLMAIYCVFMAWLIIMIKNSVKLSVTLIRIALLIIFFMQMDMVIPDAAKKIKL